MNADKKDDATVSIIVQLCISRESNTGPIDYRVVATMDFTTKPLMLCCPGFISALLAHSALLYEI